MNSNLTVLPIVAPKDIYKLNRPVNPILPDVATGAMVLLISPVKTGKSTLISNLLLSPNFYKGVFDIVYIISNTIMNDTTSRFLRDQYKATCYPEYDDSIITRIIAYQESFPKEDQPKIAIILDDCVGSVPRNSMVNHLATRYRHYGVGMLLFSSQVFRALPSVVRANATHVICGSPNNNAKEMEKLSDELGAAFGGPKNWLKLYKQCARKRYDFMYNDLESTPALVYRNFSDLIYTAKTNEDNAREMDEVTSSDEED
jgi:hypothetical protein